MTETFWPVRHLVMTEPRTLLVTGASAGIGHAISTRLLADGERVIGLARDLRRFSTAGRCFEPVSIDLADLERLPDRLTALARSHPEISAVICCAGAGWFGSLEQMSYADIRSLIDLNFTSQVCVVRAFLPLIKRNGSGDIVLMGSEAALSGGRYGAVYSATKFALRGLAQSLREECAAAGVRITIVNPGMVRTRFFDQLDFEPGPDPANIIEPEDVAEAVAVALSVRTGTVFDEINLTPLKRVVRKKKI